MKFYLNSNKYPYIFQYNGEILNISILAGTGCQQTWQGHTGKEQKYFVCLKLSILSYQILKYPIPVHTNIKFKSISGSRYDPAGPDPSEIFKQLLRPQFLTYRLQTLNISFSNKYV